VGFVGITALGDPAALEAVLDAGVADTAQVCLNLLNPSAAFAVPAGFPAQDFGRVAERAWRAGTGVIVIRVLAAGALSGVEPIASGPDYATDVGRARTLMALVREGHAGSLVEAALRLPLASAAVSTVLLGYSSLDQLEAAAAAVAKGPLSGAAVAWLERAWGEMAGGR
jgi:aryl-alcohol dehydrogenase-like predicted oxidoreductase